ncbi:4-hydroxythreonine-4-phosphate dehydrogenase PdxA [Rhodococcus wratislaviensis]|uniref:4-hydroxythreonine-4-phosphate dehydrogenase n=1 Tax=Rhodococcus wratislaviensis NBRC 100605 TaxID=1219028 RepID=X0Q121_RHOWR|nr:4-hydroxythreonine-4-phosphate dehydrogenase PdxA [Rhodococcus wratislaviensis]GAF49683.1 4-hydroxythreonine-4-phosphate dehydrogenase [Rhodococcus wratislaviensis NBRC 100605]
MRPKSIGSDPTVAVLADDLSGAAEVASAFLDRSAPVSLLLGAAETQEPGGVVIADLDTRSMSPEDAARAVRHALAGVPSDALVVKKIDSLLRGNIGPEVGILADTGPVVVAAGLPALGRTVRHGVVHVGATPLHRAGVWSAESTPPPESIAGVFPDSPTQCVRRGPGVERSLARAVSAGAVAICDVETDEDLDSIVHACRAIPGVRLVGTSALAAAVARTLPLRHVPTTAARRAESVLIVVGTAEPVAVQQVASLVADGVRHVPVDATQLLRGDVDTTPLRHVLDDGPTVVTVSGAVEPSNGRALSAALGRLVAALQNDRRADLVLTGGETARAVVDALGITSLRPVHEVHHGAVASLASDGRRVVTRPGSFGDPTSLSAIAAYLRGAQPPTHTPTQRGPHMTASTDTANLPVVAVTMGDGAGIGPEVIVPALLDGATRSWCTPVVIGDAKRLRLAANVLGIDVDIVTVESVADAQSVPGRVNVIDLDLLPDDLPWGELSPVAGHAAYEYIRVASELAVRGEVQAICTAPLNKEALHAAGHIFPGHTELLAHLTGTEEVSMMLSTPKLKVIHVTTHIGLLDAVAKIEPGLVERTIRRGHDALVRSGIPEPKIGVCGINPHAGEHGLFGYGEEEQKIIPAVEVLKADGIDVHGPLPADTAFFLAGRGDYDLIVAMYHDQGHGPVKVLGIEAGVNITVGLPVIRTSVDHGTAFDIAGKGIAEAGSMVEALRQAAELATSTAVVK